MDRPKFAVGERVMVRCVNSVELNTDDTVVVCRRYRHEGFIDRVTGEHRRDATWQYCLAHAANRYVSEKAILPRPEPAGDFNTMMTTLKQPSRETCEHGYRTPS